MTLTIADHVTLKYEANSVKLLWLSSQRWKLSRLRKITNQRNIKPAKIPKFTICVCNICVKMLNSICSGHTPAHTVFSCVCRIKSERYQSPSTSQELNNILDTEGLPAAGWKEGNEKERVFLWTSDLKVFQPWVRMKFQDLKSPTGNNLLCLTSHQKAAVRYF